MLKTLFHVFGLGKLLLSCTTYPDIDSRTHACSCGSDKFWTCSKLLLQQPVKVSELLKSLAQNTRANCNYYSQNMMKIFEIEYNVTRSLSEFAHIMIR